MVWISLNRGFILKEIDFSGKNIFLVFLPYGTYKNGPSFFLCTFNDMIRNISTSFRTIATESICLYSLLSWFVGLFNKRSAVFNWHMCKNYPQKIWFQSLDSRRNSVFSVFHFKSFFHFFYDNTSQEGLIWSKRMTHENDPRVSSTRMTHEFHLRHWPTRMSRKTHVTHAI